MLSILFICRKVKKPCSALTVAWQRGRPEVGEEALSVHGSPSCPPGESSIGCFCWTAWTYAGQATVSMKSKRGCATRCEAQCSHASVTVLTPRFGVICGTYAQALLNRCWFEREHRLTTESIHSFKICATVQSERSYEKQVAARRARPQECFAQLALSSTVSLYKDKPQQPAAPRKQRQQLAIQPVRKS